MPRKGTYTDKERELVYPKSNIYLSSSTELFLIKVNIKKSVEDDDKRNINIASAFIDLIISTSSIEYIEDYIAKQKA